MRFLTVRCSTAVLLTLLVGLACPTMFNKVKVQRSESDPRPAPKRLWMSRSFSQDLYFEENRGQADSSVKYLGRTGNQTVFLTSSEAIFTAAPQERQDQTSRSSLVRLQLEGGKFASEPRGEEPLPGKINYFRGNSRKNWQRDLPTYRKVRYPSVYPGIDLVYHGSQGALEYDFVVAPRTDPSIIRVRFGGAQELKLDNLGNLDLELQGHRVVILKPFAYQFMNGQRRPVEASYALGERSTVTFRVGKYDPRTSLVIDPVVVYSTYLGGDSSSSQGTFYTSDFGQAIAVYPNGEVVVAGFTYASNFPLKNSFDPVTSGDGELFISRFSADGRELRFSTYLGGSANERLGDLTLDSEGNILLAGSTRSTDFPLLNPFDSNNVEGEAFVVKLYGPVEVEGIAGVQIQAVARITSSNGTHGFFDDVDPGNATRRGILPYIRNLLGERTNIGINNPGDSTAHVVLTLRNDLGSLISSRTWEVPPKGMTQLDVAGANVALGSAQLVSDQPILAWSSLIDNLTEDPALIVSRSDGTSRLLIPSVTNVGRFNSSLGVLNLESFQAEVEVALRDRSGLQLGSTRQSIPPLGLLDLADIVTKLVGTNAFGPLEIRSLNSARLQAVSRVSSTSRTGGFFDGLQY